MSQQRCVTALRFTRYVEDDRDFTQCIQVDDVPYTLNGKKVEVPVRKVKAWLRIIPVFTYIFLS